MEITHTLTLSHSSLDNATIVAEEAALLVASAQMNEPEIDSLILDCPGEFHAVNDANNNS